MVTRLEHIDVFNVLPAHLVDSHAGAELREQRGEIFVHRVPSFRAVRE